MSKLRRLALKERASVHIDFRPTVRMEAPGALLLVAELDRIRRMLGSAKSLSCNLPADEIIRQLVHQIGILTLLNHPIPASNGLYDVTVRNWSYATGTTVKDEAGSWLDNYDGKISPKLLEGMWKGISEALLNSFEHAYKGDRSDGCASFREPRWWMFTHDNEAEQTLTVAVCDLGIGITRSLPNEWGRADIRRIFRAIGAVDLDVASIHLALKIGQSSTRKPNRGVGLPQIWNGMKAANVGGIAILSDKGFLRYEAKTQTETSRQFSDSIFGTLIMWTVPVDTVAALNG